jgi:hypothetical protein
MKMDKIDYDEMLPSEALELIRNAIDDIGGRTKKLEDWHEVCMMDESHPREHYLEHELYKERQKNQPPAPEEHESDAFKYLTDHPKQEDTEQPVDSKREAPRCEHCGGTNIYSGPPDCPRCGAPVCCEDCCKKDFEERYIPTEQPEGMRKYIGYECLFSEDGGDTTEIQILKCVRSDDFPMTPYDDHQGTIWSWCRPTEHTKELFKLRAVIERAKKYIEQCEINLRMMERNGRPPSSGAIRNIYAEVRAILNES